MSTTTPRRGPATTTTTPTGASGRRAGPAAGSAASPTPTARGVSPSHVLASSGTAGASAKYATPTGRPARPATRRPAGSASNPAADEEAAKAEEARAEGAARMESLRRDLHEAETASQEYQRQLATAESKIDDLMSAQARLEEQYQQSSDRVQELEFDQRESKRHAQEMERIYDGERTAMLRDREDAAGKEKELKVTIQRLKETVAERELHGSAGSPHGDTGATPKAIDDAEPQFAPSLGGRKDSQGSRVLVQKDQIIESLRLEVAEAQIKLVEMENAGGGRVQELEKTLLETRMTNARLLEDNESFQLLLGERTISGDFQKTELMQGAGGSNTTPSGLGSLAEELESAEGESAYSRRLEGEVKALKDQNKALTLYIEKIISRVLQHDNFETILDQKGGLGAIPGRGFDKELPPPPGKDEKGSGDGFLQRATSVVRRQRPVSAMFAPGTIGEDTPNLTARHTRNSSAEYAPPSFRQPTANEDPNTAPSIPLGRSMSQRGGGRNHNRLSSVSANSGAGSGGGPPTGPLTGSSLGSIAGTPRTADPPRSADIPGAAGIVNQMYRGPSGTGSPTAQSISPLMSPGGSRGAYFGGTHKTPTSPSSKPRQSSESTVSATNLASSTDGNDSPSPPPTSNLRPETPSGPSTAASLSAAGTGTGTPSSASASGSVHDGSNSLGLGSPPRDRQGSAQYTGAVMQQNRLRPLRLVQQSGSEDEAAAKKKANRGSWMGWFNRGVGDGSQPPGGLPGVGE